MVDFFFPSTVKMEKRVTFIIAFRDCLRLKHLCQSLIEVTEVPACKLFVIGEFLKCGLYNYPYGKKNASKKKIDLCLLLILSSRTL